jgi:hypothetical protein
MDLPILSAAALGMAILSVVGGGDSLQSSSATSSIEGPDTMVGQTLWASEDPIDRWGDPVRAEDLVLEDLGVVAEVVTTPEGEARAVVVAVGGLWGVGAEPVELGMERVHLIPAADGEPRLVVDLSSAGAEPPVDGAEL